VDLQDALAAPHVGARHHYAPVEAPRPQQGRVEDVGTVGCGNEYDTFVGLEAIHLHQQGIQRLLALVVAATQAGAAMATDGVDLVDEDDAGSILLALLKQVPDSRRAHAHEHLYKVGAGYREERDIGFAGDGSCQKRLAGSRGAYQQHALGDASAQLLELLGLAEEVNNLVQLFLGFVHTRYVLKRHLLLLARKQAGTTLAEGKRLVAAALHLAHKEDPEAHEDDHREQPVAHPRKPGTT